MFDDISFLVQETFKNVEEQSSKNFINQIFSDAYEGPDEVPGFFYNLQKKSSTFVLRILPSENLKKDLKNIKKHPDMYPALRLEEDDRSLNEKIQFFECDRFEIAQNIRKHLGNKRFPIFEERVFNISDPGDSWWLEVDGSRLSVHFKLSKTQDISKLIKLGPLGETKYCMDIFAKLYGYFKLIFPVGDYSSAHGQLCISTTDSYDANFQHFIQLLKTGETSHDFWNELRKLEVNASDPAYLDSIQRANYFLMELAFTRHFWRTVQEQL